MSILVFAPRYAPDAGGIETLLAELLPELAAEGLELVVAAGTDRDDLPAAEVVDGIPVYRFPFGTAVLDAQPAQILAVTRRLREVEAAHDVTVRHVHGFGDIGLWYALRAHQRAPLPLAVSVHGTFEALGRLGPSALALLRVADVVTAVSEAVRASAVATVPELAGRVRLIRNGLRARDEEPAPRPLGGSLLAVGRLLEQKGFDVAIDALAQLGATHPELELTLAGIGPGGPDLRRRAEHRGVGTRVHFVGQLRPAQVRQAIDDAAIVLVPSRSIEGFSLVTLEAAQGARPVIASRVGGLGETIDDGTTGVLVPPGDPTALAGAIAGLLDDPARATAMGTAARRHAEERFAFEPCARAYRRLYDELDASGATCTTADLTADLTAAAASTHG